MRALSVISAAALLVIVIPACLWGSPVPEIDASSGMSAVAVLVGAVAVLRAWRKK
jgi:hypothetical protein